MHCRCLYVCLCVIMWCYVYMPTVYTLCECWLLPMTWEWNCVKAWLWILTKVLDGFWQSPTLRVNLGGQHDSFFFQNLVRNGTHKTLWAWICHQSEIERVGSASAQLNSWNLWVRPCFSSIVQYFFVPGGSERSPKAQCPFLFIFTGPHWGCDQNQMAGFQRTTRTRNLL